MYISLVRYWNYIVSPLIVLIALFSMYVVATLKSIQTMNTRQVADGIERMRRKVSSGPT
jgi:hypothetical protein